MRKRTTMTTGRASLCALGAYLRRHCFQQFPLMNCESYVTVAADTSRSVSTTHYRLLERLSQSARTRYLVARRLIS
jgi:hypothetical protein